MVETDWKIVSNATTTLILQSHHELFLNRKLNFFLKNYYILAAPCTICLISEQKQR